MGHHHDHHHADLTDERGPGTRHRPHGRGRGDFGGPPWGGGRRRMRRGVIRRTLLSTLETEPAHGYEIMRRLEERSGGMWRPSPGSVYPTLQMLEDEGAVRSEQREGTRVYELTDKGRQELADTPAGPGEQVPWEDDDGTGDPGRALRHAVGQLAAAAKMLVMSGTNPQVERGIDVLKRARKDLYQILSED